MSGHISEKGKLVDPLGSRPKLLPTDAVRGFLYVPTCEGTPTGIPEDMPGQVPMVFDSTNQILYLYYGGTWNAV